MVTAGAAQVAGAWGADREAPDREAPDREAPDREVAALVADPEAAVAVVATPAAAGAAECCSR